MWIRKEIQEVLQAERYKMINVGEIWVARKDAECAAKVEKIDTEKGFVWCSADFWRGIFPVEMDRFLETMIKIKTADGQEVSRLQLDNYSKAAGLPLNVLESSTFTEAGGQRN